ncbi:SAM hydrolase/SAM-dependent halogenase family protein [Alienimonas californiensis]|uniref:Adenosyl-chloride synthase n=1 Tax=Alienimonas californiensis TaxID=2527989 RepID=A0A517P9C0_9PLAN|nr:SAM-dependent chlorinase/fluorinase [Alienimonas californiensis]QDT15955.1 Adenosyl-chloride synthase [Alienimonas californiensis]
MLPRATPAPLDDAPPNGAVVFVTDFGTTDTYAAQMIGALLRTDPHAQAVAGYHAVPPQDVLAGAEVLAELVAAFPPGTTFVTVVDPGVGTERAILAATAGGMFHVAPDNGLLAPLLAADPAAEVVRLPQAGSPSRTFHGRDLMTPAAGRLTRGEPLRMLGEPTAEWVKLDRPTPERRPDGAVVGQILRADRFGNLLTNVSRRDCPAPARATLAGHTLPVGGSYADAVAGEPLALVGSNGRWEIAVRNGSAAAVLNAAAGDAVTFLPTSQN